MALGGFCGFTIMITTTVIKTSTDQDQYNRPYQITRIYTSAKLFQSNMFTGSMLIYMKYG